MRKSNFSHVKYKKLWKQSVIQAGTYLVLKIKETWYTLGICTVPGTCLVYTPRTELELGWTKRKSLIPVTYLVHTWYLLGRYCTVLGTTLVFQVYVLGTNLVLIVYRYILGIDLLTWYVLDTYQEVKGQPCTRFISYPFYTQLVIQL